MRILFLTNFFPPQARGGFELWAHEAAVGLREKGHEVLVLTQRKTRLFQQTDSSWVRRCFYPEMALVPIYNSVRFFTHRERHERHNLIQLNQALEIFQPDAAVIWGMWNLHRSLSARVEAVLGDNVVYYIGDYWLTLPSQHKEYWQVDSANAVARLVKSTLRPHAQRALATADEVALRVPHALFPTQYMRRELVVRGVTPRNSEIVTGAVDLKAFVHAPTPVEGRLELLYIGRICHEKGVHTAVQALAKLIHEQNIDCRLTIVGKRDTTYMRWLMEQVDQLQVRDAISVHIHQPTEKIIELCQQSDMLLFTSIWDEPFGRVLVEAMAAGLVVIGTGTGGSAEIMTEANSLRFAPEDADGLAGQIYRAYSDPNLYMTLATAGQQHVLEQFNSARFVNGIEAFLTSLVNPLPIS